MAEYIEREALIAEYDRVHIGEAGGARKLMVDAPACDVVEVVHGYWVKNAPNPEAMKSFHELGIAKAMRENSIYWTCSCCNEWGFPYSKYCSNCGAKMNSERRSENENT